MNSHAASLAPYSRSTLLPAARLVRTPRLARWLGKLLFVAFLVTPFALLFVPWAQTVEGRGQVVAYEPDEREQVVTAPISGIIQRWYFAETDRVKKGDLLVELGDNDPDFAIRLGAQRDFLYSRKKAMLAQINEQQNVVKAQKEARTAGVDAAEAVVRANEQAVEATRKALEGAEALVQFERVRYAQFDKLLKNPIGGLESELNVLEALNRKKRSEADVARINEEIARGQASIKQAMAGVKRADADGLSAIATANGNLARVEQDLFNLEREIQIIDTQIQRFEARFVKAPCDGIILRIEPDASQLGQAVKDGQALALVVPETEEPVVALYVEGVDAPLIQPDPDTGEYPAVRLQFEGWPAIQFGPAPDYSYGTFGGRVIRIDPTNNERGQFRVLVREEGRDDLDRWPAREYLRQGNQAQGFIFLRQVPLGYELWRRLNGFPQMTPPLDSKKGKGDKKEAKPPKVKIK